MRRPRSAAGFLLAVVVVFSVWAPRAVAQRGGGPAPPRADGARVEIGRGEISGLVVTDAPMPKPLRRATVSLRNFDSSTTSTYVTDDNGRFAFRNLPANRFGLSAAKPAYVTANYGATSGRGQGLTIALADGQVVPDITIRVPRGAVITGRVLDERGRPQASARVMAAEQVMVNGLPTVTRVLNAGSNTDDNGTYRVYGLAAGTYVIAVTVSDSLSAVGLGSADAVSAPTPAEVQAALRATTPASAAGRPAAPRAGSSRYVPTYYPGTTDAASASTIAVTAGEERSGVDVTALVVPTATVTGTLTRADGAPARNAQVVAVSTGRNLSMGLLDIPPRAVIDPAGRFSVASLPPGHYLVTARAPSGTAAPPTPAGGRGGLAPLAMDLWATAELDVNGQDVNDVRLTLAPGMAVAGRLVFNSALAAAPPDAGDMTVRLLPPPGAGVSLGVPAGQVDANRSFAFSGSAPGLYLLDASVRNSAPGQVPAWMIKSATIGGRDAIDTPFEVRPGVDIADAVVTFTDQITQISGKLLDQNDRPAGGYFVMVFPTNTANWRAQSRWIRTPVRPATDGAFAFNALPPGEYYLAALTDFNQAEVSTPAFLQQLVPLSLKFTLAEGEKRRQDLRIK